jgi:putative Mn2+ efflux pump MntP
MGILEMIFLGLGLSFDTFAVSVSTGLVKNTIRFWQGVRVALVLAFFQGLMPLIGWFGGSQLVSYMAGVDHWIAFGLLSVVGIKMIIESFKADEDKKNRSLSFRVLMLMGIATSMDALVVGLSLAFFEIDILQSIIIIGFITFMAAMIGMLIGKSSNKKFGKKIEVVGGLILIGIGFKILMAHIA